MNHSVDDDLIDRFLTRLKRIKGEDHGKYQLYRRCLEKYDKWLDREAQEISPLDIEDYLLGL